MKNILILSLFLSVFSSCKEEEPLLSACMDSKVDEILSEEVWNPPAQIYSYQFKGEQVFYLTPRCCDFFGEVYDAQCKFICAPDGGITGTGDGNCPDFFQQVTDGKLVWEDPRATCQTAVLIDEDLYETAPEGYGKIERARVEDDCLYVRFGASGCSGDSWTWSLIDSGTIMESSPEQRAIKFSLENVEMCAAYFEKEVSFDITPLRITGSQKIYLNLKDYGAQLVYEY